MSATHEDAVCLRHWEYSETSQVVSLFTRQLGLVRALAKGSRRPKTPFSGGLETLTRGTAGLIAKPDADLALLTDWDLVETFGPLRTDLGRYHASAYIAEITQLALRDHDPHPGLYDALLGALRGLCEHQAPVAVLIAYQWALLDETGYRPNLAPPVPPTAAPGPGSPASASGGRGVPGGPSSRSRQGRAVMLFSPERGEFVVRASAREATVWRVRRETVGVLERVQSGQAVEGGPATERGARLLAWYLRTVLGREPNTFRLVFGSPDPRA